MIVKCPVCGKATDVQWPHLWRYKREGMYMCSYGCMRAYDDKKGSNTDMPLNDNQRKTAIDMAMRGESPLKYISEQGIKNPSCTWWNIKQYLSKNDPETYAKLPAKIKGTKAEPKKPETPETTRKGLTIETPEGNARITHIEIPEKETKDIGVTPIEYRITGISTTAGEFQYFKKQGYIDWTALDGITVSLQVEEWAELMKIWPHVLKVLGVEA